MARCPGRRGGGDQDGAGAGARWPLADPQPRRPSRAAGRHPSGPAGHRLPPTRPYSDDTFADDPLSMSEKNKPAPPGLYLVCRGATLPARGMRGGMRHRVSVAVALALALSTPACGSDMHAAHHGR